MNVHQVLSGAGPVDAVTSQALAFRRLFGLLLRRGYGPGLAREAARGALAAATADLEVPPGDP